MHQPPRPGTASTCGYGCGRELLTNLEVESGRCDSCAGRGPWATYRDDLRRRAHTVHLDPTVSRYLYALRDLDVVDQETAVRVLDVVGGGDLTPEQRAELLAAIVPPGGDDPG